MLNWMHRQGIRPNEPGASSNNQEANQQDNSLAFKREWLVQKALGDRNPPPAEAQIRAFIDEMGFSCDQMFNDLIDPSKPRRLDDAFEKHADGSLTNPLKL